MDKRDWIWLTLFSIAMAFLESAVVVYLREIYYPNGFQFPLVPIESKLAVTELIREFATLVMLLGIGILVGKTKIERFAYFIYSFAVWDIFYYVFLKCLLNWPDSIFTWDVLFLIPITWVGPVIAPIITSITMIILAIVMVKKANQVKNFRLKFFEIFMLILGSLVTIFSFIQDYFGFLITNYKFSEWNYLNNNSIFGKSANYIPSDFNWWIFLLAELILAIPIVSIYRGLANSINSFQRNSK
ncbi:MAG: hypothetical protein DWP98_09965 [Bacteroidetes bacterium]|nr:MAG: hypothetical protein DWP98_09965 [Bacteroidota bacterium]MBL1144741.1 hypothetical protein [Bacteroidota bacterium]NOG57535.1 hypothetical protein [Bacteroidota bacterium]